MREMRVGRLFTLRSCKSFFLKTLSVIHTRTHNQSQIQSGESWRCDSVSNTIDTLGTAKNCDRLRV